MIDVVMFSSGAGSYAAALRVAERRRAAGLGLDGLKLLFADVTMEDEDNYRFLHDAAADVGGELVIVRDGRDIWQVFRDKRFLGNSRLANCSDLLKQKPAREWLDANCDPATTTIHLGIDWSEEHRLAGVRKGYSHPYGVTCDKGWCRSLYSKTTGELHEGPGCRKRLDVPWRVEAPLTEPPYLDREQVFALMEQRGVKRPRLYDLGMAHANCGGGCVRSGKAAFAHLRDVMPERYAEWEANEAGLRKFLGRDDVAIIRDRPPGRPVVPLTLTSFREQLELRERRERDAGRQLDIFDALVDEPLFDPNDVGGCGCFVAEDEQESADA